MRIDYEDHGTTTVLRLEGVLNADQTDTFRRACEARFDAGVRDVVLELSKLQLVDSAGLESLLWLEEATAGQFGHLVLAGTTEMVEQILRVTRLDGRFALHADVETAARSLR